MLCFLRELYASDLMSSMDLSSNNNGPSPQSYRRGVLCGSRFAPDPARDLGNTDQA